MSENVINIRFNILSVIKERLSGQSLDEWLVDCAEDTVEIARPGFHEEDVEETKISVDGSDFLVQFVLPNAGG